jgi:uncharacterized protein involved in exopolysaccharide biosynthesis
MELGAYLAILWRRKWVIAGTLVLTLAGALAKEVMYALLCCWSWQS